MISHFSFQIFAWMASVFYAVEFVMAKLVSKHTVKDPWLLNFLWAAMLCLFTVPVALYFHAGMPKSWLFIVLAGLFGALANVFYFFILRRIDVSALGPLYNVRTIFVLILATILLGERLTIFQLALILLMILGGVLVTMDEKFSWRFFFSLTGILVIGLMLVLAFMPVFIKTAIAGNNYWTVILWTTVLGWICILPTIWLFKRRVAEISFSEFGFLFGAVVLGGLGSLAQNKAYAENATISSAIIAIPLSSIVAFGFSVLAPELLEKHPAKIYAIRFVGAALMVYGGIKLI